MLRGRIGVRLGESPEARAEEERGLDSPVSGRDGVAKPGSGAGGAYQQGNLPGLPWRHPEGDQRENLGADESAHDLAGVRVDDVGGDLAVGGDLEFAAGEVGQQQAVPQGMPGADHGGAGQLGRGLVRVEPVGGRRARPPGGGRARRLAAGRVRKSPDGQLDVLPELLVQFRSSGGGPRRQPDREGRLPGLVPV